MWTESIGFHAHFCQFVNRKTCDIQPNLEFRTEIEWDICATFFRKEQQSWGRQSLSDPDSRKAGYIYIYIWTFTQKWWQRSQVCCCWLRDRDERDRNRRETLSSDTFLSTILTLFKRVLLWAIVCKCPLKCFSSPSLRTSFPICPSLPFPFLWNEEDSRFEHPDISFLSSSLFFSASVCEILSMWHSRLPCFSYFSRSLGHVTQSVPHVDLSHVDESVSVVEGYMMAVNQQSLLEP